MVLDTSRFMGCNSMMQILVVGRKALWRVLVCMSKTLGLWISLLMWKSVEGQSLKCR